jgi:RNA polymerase sigma-70 factor, ECF subfamily
MLLVEDRSLLDAFRRGDRAALEKVYETYGPQVASFLRAGFGFQSGGRSCRFRGARSQLDLEDRLHDVFSRAFSEGARLGYDGLSPYKTYLLTIAKNTVIDDFRRKEHALIDYSIDEGPEPADPGRGDATDPILGQLAPSGDPHKDNESAELVALVRAFKDALPEREQQIYTLRFERELEHREIAKETGLSTSKIKTSEGRIRSSFFEFMKRHGYFKGYVRDRRGWLSRALGLS